MTNDKRNVSSLINALSCKTPCRIGPRNWHICKRACFAMCFRYYSWNFYQFACYGNYRKWNARDKKSKAVTNISVSRRSLIKGRGYCIIYKYTTLYDISIILVYFVLLLFDIQYQATSDVKTTLLDNPWQVWFCINRRSLDSSNLSFR